jgi:hypothetical protein
MWYFGTESSSFETYFFNYVRLPTEKCIKY